MLLNIHGKDHGMTLMKLIDSLVKMGLQFDYLALSGAGSESLRALYAPSAAGQRIRQSIRWLRDNFTEPITIEQLTQVANMAPATYHKQFKRLTSLSPMQYQKRLRLYEAQQFLLNGKETSIVPPLPWATWVLNSLTATTKSSLVKRPGEVPKRNAQTSKFWLKRNYWDGKNYDRFKAEKHWADFFKFLLIMVIIFAWAGRCFLLKSNWLNARGQSLDDSRNFWWS